MSLRHIMQSEWSWILTLSLIHFVWIGLVVGLTVWSVLKTPWFKSAQRRYVFCLAGLCVMALCSIAAFVIISHDSLSNQTAQVESVIFSESATVIAGSSANEMPIKLIQTPASFDWSNTAPFISLAYLVGAALMLVRLVVCWRRGVGLRRISEPISDSRIHQMLKRLSERMKLHVQPAIASCRRAASPMVVGVLKPMVLIPAAMLSDLSIVELEAILAHELAHIRRYDPWINLLQSIIEALLFFHPAVWWLSQQVRIEREHCCDDMACLTSGGTEGRRLYAASLLRVAELAAKKRETQWMGQLAATGNSRTLRSRIIRLLDIPQPVPAGLSRRGVTVFAALILSITVVAGVVFAVGEDPDLDVAGEPDMQSLITETQPPSTSDDKEKLTLTSEGGQLLALGSWRVVSQVFPGIDKLPYKDDAGREGYIINSPDGDDEIKINHHDDESSISVLNGRIQIRSQNMVLTAQTLTIHPESALLTVTGVGHIENHNALSNATRVQPDDLKPSTQEYRVGAGDQVTIDIFELKALGEMEHITREVDETGQVNLPLIGRIRIQGETASSMQELIAKRLEEEDVLKTPRVHATITNKIANRFTIIGSPKNNETTKYGVYPIPSPSFRLLDAVATAGGLSSQVKMLYIYRTIDNQGEVEGDFASSQRIIKAPYDKLLAGEMRYNLMIRPGDIIHVPSLSVGNVYIDGDIARPGAYALSGSKGMTVQQLLASAGGAVPDGQTPQRVILRRRLGEGREAILHLDFEAIFQGDNADIFLLPEDFVHVVKPTQPDDPSDDPTAAIQLDLLKHEYRVTDLRLAQRSDELSELRLQFGANHDTVQRMEAAVEKLQVEKAALTKQLKELRPRIR